MNDIFFRPEFVSPKFLDPQLLAHLEQMANNKSKNTFYGANDEYFFMSKTAYLFPGKPIIILLTTNCFS